MSFNVCYVRVSPEGDCLQGYNFSRLEPNVFADVETFREAEDRLITLLSEYKLYSERYDAHLPTGMPGHGPDDPRFVPEHSLGIMNCEPNGGIMVYEETNYGNIDYDGMGIVCGEAVPPEVRERIMENNELTEVPDLRERTKNKKPEIPLSKPPADESNSFDDLVKRFQQGKK